MLLRERSVVQLGLVLCFFLCSLLVFVDDFFSSISGADGRGEETRSPGGYACV